MALVFHHRGSMGDIIYSLPTVMAFGGGILWIRKKPHYEWLHTLLERQPCIRKVINDACGLNGFVNLDGYRIVERKAYRSGHFKHLAECHLLALGKESDISKPWLQGIESQMVADIVVSRSTRYHDREDIDWKLLDGCDVLFIGFMDEYEQFLSLYGVSSFYYECKDALEMAQIIKGSKLFLGNQSLGFAIAEGLKHPRVLEVYHKNANCMPQSDNGYTYLDEELLGRCLI